MEDRYLYKAKSIYSEEWVQGYYAFINNHHYIYSGSLYNGGLYVVPEKFEINIDTLCACTGLKDKRGNLIWENDIVKALFSDVYAKIKYGSYRSCFDSTKNEHVGFYVDWSGRYAKSRRKDLGYWINMVDAEIVGNIFDNPELLESEE